MAMQNVGVRAVIEGLGGYLSGMDRMDRATDKVGTTSTRAGSAMSRGFGLATGALVALGAAAAAAAGAAGLGSVISVATDFEKTMSGVKAVSGATADEMQRLSSLALQLGKDTSFSASEAGKGIEELVKAGVSVADIMGGAALAAVNLAAAGDIDLASAAEIAANAMSQFSLKGSDMARVADLIAGAANASSLDVRDFQLSLAAAGAVSAVTGQTFDSLATAIAVMGAAGIKSSDAGTSLKTMLLNLQPTTDKQIGLFRDLGLMTEEGANAFFDATGKAKSFRDIAQVLQVALADLTEQQRLAALETIFGSDAIRAGAVLAREGAAGFDEMAAAMGKVTAASVAATRLDNFSGSLEQLKGSLETAMIVIGTAFLPALTKIATELGNIVDAAVPWLERVGPQLSAAFTDLGAAVEFARSAVQAGVSGLLDIVQDAVPQIEERLTFWGRAFVEWIGPHIPGMIEEFHRLREQAFAWVVEQIPGWIDTLGRWGLTLVEWIAPMIPPALGELTKFLGRTIDWVIANAPMLLETFLAEWVPAALGWVGSAALELAKQLPAIIVTIGKFILESVPKIFELANQLGLALVDGIISGLGSLASRFISTILGELNRTTDTVRNVFDIRSPSGVYREIGEQIVEGLVLGIKEGTPEATKASEDLAKEAARAAKEAVRIEKEAARERERAERDAERERKEAEREAEEARRKAEEEAKRAREAALARTLGVTARDTLGGIRGRGSATGTAGGAAADLAAAIDGIQRLAAAEMDTSVATDVLNNALGKLTANFGVLSGDDLASAGAVSDGMRHLQEQLAAGEISTEEFLSGLRAYAPELTRLGGVIDDVFTGWQDEAKKTAEEMKRLREIEEDALRTDRIAQHTTALHHQRLALERENEAAIKSWNERAAAAKRASDIEVGIARAQLGAGAQRLEQEHRQRLESFVREVAPEMFAQVAEAFGGAPDVGFRAALALAQGPLSTDYRIRQLLGALGENIPLPSLADIFPSSPRPDLVALPPGGAGGSSGGGITNNFVVNASYADVQSPANVRMDLEALVLLASR